MNIFKAGSPCTIQRNIFYRLSFPGFHSLNVAQKPVLSNMHITFKQA